MWSKNFSVEQFENYLESNYIYLFTVIAFIYLLPNSIDLTLTSDVSETLTKSWVFSFF